MAKKKNSNEVTTKSLAKMFSYIGLVTAALLYILIMIMEWVKGDLGNVQSWLELIRDISLLIGIGVGAWDFCKRKKLAWRIIYIVSVVVFVVFAILKVAI